MEGIDKKLAVGVSVIPPLIVKAGDKYTGFEIELWEKIANELNLKYLYKEYDFKDILKAVEKKEVDIAIAAITRTEEREKLIDFSHLTLKSGLLILVSKKSKAKLFSFFQNILLKNYRRIFYILLSFLIFVFVFGNIMWLVERNSGAFNNSYAVGIVEAFWWTIVTVSTVGYGDFTPLTLPGKIIGTIVIFIGLAIFGIFISETTSLLTLTKIKYKINSYRDLEGKKVATKEDTAAVKSLNELNAIVVPTKNIEESYRLLRKGEVDAVVFDAPVIMHYIKNDINKDLIVVGDIFENQTYGIAINEKNQDLKEEINEILLRLKESGVYNILYKKWFGDINKK